MLTTPLQSFVFKLKKALLLSPQSEKDIHKRIFNFQWGDKTLLLCSFVWLLWIGYKYQIFSSRPPVLYDPGNWFSSVFLPTFPSPCYFYCILCLALGCITYSLFKPEIIFIRFLLSASLLWLNAFQWGYGYLSHVGHIFIFSHLLSIFLPRKFNTDKEAKWYSQGIAFYRMGILATYSMAGLWKAGGLLSKFTSPDGDYNWLHSKAFLLNAIVSFRSSDYPFHPLLSVFEIPAIWALCFGLMVIVQIFVVLSAFSDRLHPWVIAILVCFHLFNAIAFHTVFIWQPLVILILLFPYHIIFKNSFTTVTLNSSY